MATSQYSIESISLVGQQSIVTINAISIVRAAIEQQVESSANIFAVISQTILSSAAIKEPVIFYCQATITKPKTDDKFAEVNILNPIPSAPTSLVAVDAGTGDVVVLNWISTATRFNVYKKVGAVYTKLNPLVLENVTIYRAGGLTPDVAVDFVVRALNGLDQESGDSNVATATPTFANLESAFSTPTWEVYINGSLRSDAILSDVKLAFGGTFSTAAFSLPVDFRSVSGPNKGALITIYVNGRLIFRGTITSKEYSLNLENGLLITYRCHSGILDLVESTVYSTDIDSVTTAFNILESTPDGQLRIKNPASAQKILAALGIPNGPNVFPGYIDITDQTPLAAAELVLSTIGNYRLYYDMSSGVTSVFNFGSNGYNIREFYFNKNIIDYTVQESDIDVVKSLTLIGAPIRQKVKTMVSDLVVSTDPDGKLALSFELSAKNLRDIQLFGWAKEKPTVLFDDNVEVSLADFGASASGSSSSSGSLLDNSFSLDTSKLNPASTSNNATSPGEPAVGSSYFFNLQGQQVGTQNASVNDVKLYPAVKQVKRYSAVRQGISAKIIYDGPDKATVYLSEAPKIWYTITRSGNVKRSDIGLPGNGTLSVTILLGYDFSVGTVEVEFVYDDSPPVIVVGSGVPSRSITDSQYGIIRDGVSGYSNEVDILNRMSIRANGELAKLNKDNIDGSITILGDETLDLRSSVRVNGQLLNISGISHNFTNGFTTTVTLTNEPFFKNIIVPPLLVVPSQPKDLQHRSKVRIDDYQDRNLRDASRELAAQKEKTDKVVPSSGQAAKAL